MMKYIFLGFFVISTFISCKNSDLGAIKDGELTWLTVEQASELSAKGTKKKFLVDVYTDWCGWCKVMDKKTFTDPALIKYLNDNFHVVKFDAEQKESVTYRGKQYNWEAMGRNGINALGMELLQGRMSYPTLVYLNEKLEPLTVSPGYKDPAQLMIELQAL